MIYKLADFKYLGKLREQSGRLRLRLLQGAHCDCRSCVHRSWWKIREHDGQVDGWYCDIMWGGRWLRKGVFLPACGLANYRTSVLKYLAYRLYCRFVFDEVLVARALRRLDGHLD